MEKPLKDDFKRYPCLCCGYMRRWFEEHGTYDLCEICGWGDDHLQSQGPDRTGCANKMSLNQARASYAEYGAKSQEALVRVRKPLPGRCPSREGCEWGVLWPAWFGTGNEASGL
ncbi:CPCC family cysteine-rich protein [Pelagibius sp. Alg239-R121]|uniref:CPCC family cysteine-rich protein n=1 Tax=Pelagibius sp. Alg239-R121 TaxID=2993448 RepID=UPI00345F511C